MKIKPYTAEETEELIQRINFVVKQTELVNNKATKFLDELYNKYLENFKMSFFFWKPLKKSKFFEYISNTEFANLITVDDNWYWDKSPLRQMIPIGTVLVRSEEVYLFYSDKLLKKYNIEFTNDEKRLFANASQLSSYVQSYENNDKIKVILNYAKRPFEFEESDVEWLEKFNDIYNIAMEYNL